MRSSPDIALELKESGTTLILQAERGNPYEVPTGYFEQLPEKVLSLVKIAGEKEVHAELEGIAPLLNKISKQGPYEIPRGYFEQPIQKNDATRPSRGHQAILKKLVRLAAAAAIAGIVLIAVNNVSKQRPSVNDTVQIPSSISETALNEFLDNEASSGTEIIDWPTVSSEWTSDNTRDLFEGVSLQELEQFSQQFNAHTNHSIN